MNLARLSQAVRRVASVFFGTLATAAALTHTAHAADAYVIDIEGGIGAASAEIVRTGMRKAIDADADLIVLRMDTPGGLDSAMRDIVSEILASPVPVATWVGPGGARAASAGTYILLASHVAAMHPTSNLGAATPVDIGGSGVTDDDAPGRPGSDGADEVADAVRDAVDGTEDAAGDDAAADEAAAEDAAPVTERNPSAMGRKIINDAVSYIRTLAERHDRNADWAEKAVRDGATLTAREAVEQNVADVLASSLDELLTAVDGENVVLDNGDTVTLATAGAEVSFFEPTWRQKLLLVISDPSIAVLLVLVGVYGLWFEAFNPGAIVPGVIGAICLLLAAYALQVMPVNYVGLGLILLGVVLMTAEIFVPSFGALGLGGIIAFIVGAIMAFDTGVPGFEISRFTLGSIAATIGALTLGTAFYARRLHVRGAVTGEVGMRKHQAVAIDDFDGEGFVWLESERWHAVSDRPVRAGQSLQVTRLDGLTVHVSPMPSPKKSAT
ncbi:MAG: nodulation protein NfeD [Pseudomonadota bacterium]